MTDTDTTGNAEPGQAITAPAGPVVLLDVCYRGTQPPGGAGTITVYTPNGTKIGIMAHFPKHSPTGMGWGYLGSGASDCARSLLAAAIGADLALCRICHGTDTITWADGADAPRAAAPGDDPDGITGCHFCDQGLYLTPAMYHRFKEVFVAHFDDTFVITRGAIIGWLNGNYPTHTWPTVID